MAWADLTITRDDIDAFEGTTFEGYNALTGLGIATNDSLVLTSAKSELEDEIIGRLDGHQYDTTVALLDAIVAADDRGLVKRMLTYKFLANWFFGDSTKEDSLSYVKAREYTAKYYRAVAIGLNGITKMLTKPQQNPRFIMRR